jgi:uncharacterized protein
MDKICFYHSADLDGKCSAAIVKRFEPDVELYPYDYGERFPWGKITPNTIVYMVDVSVDVEDMYKINKLAKQFIYIDHHISKLKELDLTQFRGFQVNGVAACILTWEYFTSVTLPTGVKLLGKYDVWDISDNVLNFQYGVRGLNLDPNKTIDWMDKIFDNFYIQEIIMNGNLIRRYVESTYAEDINKFAFQMMWHDYRVLALNKTTGSSLIFKDHPDYHNVDILMVFGWIGREWKISLYTLKKDIDVSQICKSYGGGGHEQAAGFKYEQLPFKLEV